MRNSQRYCSDRKSSNKKNRRHPFRALFSGNIAILFRHSLRVRKKLSPTWNIQPLFCSPVQLVRARQRPNIIPPIDADTSKRHRMRRSITFGGTIFFLGITSGVSCDYEFTIFVRLCFQILWYLRYLYVYDCQVLCFFNVCASMFSKNLVMHFQPTMIRKYFLLDILLQS